MIRVCHVTSVHKSGDNRIFRKECVSLAEAGYDVTLVAPGESREEQGVHVLGVGEIPSSRQQRLRSGAIGRVGKAAAALDCDMYHIHDPELLPFLRSMAKKGKKTVFDSHEHYGALMRDKGRSGPERALLPTAYRMMEDWVLKKTDAVIVPCTLDGINEFEGRARRTVFLDNLPRLGDAAQEWAPPGEESENTVGYVGGLSPDRGIEQMIRACHKAGARLSLAGIATREYEALLKAMPEFSSVDFAGAIPPAEIPAFCRGFRAGLCLLLDRGQFWHLDNLPTKVYEYMAAGLPVILSDTYAGRRLAEEYGCALCVDPEDGEAVAVAIRSLLDDPDRARDMGRRGQQAVRERYRWEEEQKKLLDLYKELVGSPNDEAGRIKP